jgi:gamma-glutamyltranspeptidase/glutathione hydrolase
MVRSPIVAAAVASSIFAAMSALLDAQRPADRQAPLPGDRPASNPRATRSVVLARNGLIATSQPLASAAGLRVLQEGGNAIDAAVTAAAVLAVVEPTMNGIGGDLFALVYDARTKTLKGLNASGRSPSRASLDELRRRQLAEMPSSGILSVTVPGVVDGWAELLARHGTLSLARALAPAIEYAREGFPVSEIIATQWRQAAKRLARDPAAAAVFLPGGEPPAPGQVFRNPALARSLELIARGGRDAFYRGPLAQAIVADSAARGGLFELGDFADHRSDWVEPLSTNYRGYEVFELPPNTQGLAALEMLNILEGFDLKSLGHNSAAYLHLLIEAKRIAWADRDRYLADPDQVPPAVLKTLLSKEYAAARRREIDPERAQPTYRPATIPGLPTPSGAPREAVWRTRLLLPRPEPVDEPDVASGDTIYLTAADSRGNVVSLIQSLFANFGAGIVAGDTGIVLHNRGALFAFDPTHPNALAPHKRPFHTLVPAMVFKEGRPWLSYGVMGGDMQPQGHVQVLLNLVEFGMNIQEAGEAARFRHAANGVALESAISAEARAGLEARGHRLTSGFDIFGGFQGILIDPKSGVLMGGSDPRKDGLAIGF